MSIKNRAKIVTEERATEIVYTTILAVVVALDFLDQIQIDY